MATLTIRPYSKEDKSQVLGIMAECIPTYFAPEELPELEYYLEHEIEHYFVAEIYGEIVGAGGINIDGTVGKISWDFVKPNLHGKGIGKTLLEHRITLLKGIQNVSTIRVRTSQVVYQFYERNGFVLRSVQKDYWAPGFDLYLMELA